MCGVTDFGCKVGEAFQEQLRQWTMSMVEGAVNLGGSIASAWVNIPLMPTLGEWVGGGVCEPAPGGGVICTDPEWRDSELLVWFSQNDILGWWVGAFVVLGLMTAGIRIMWRQDGAEAREILKGFLTFAVVAGAGTVTIQTLLWSGDKFSSYLLTQATGGDGSDDEANFGAGIASVLFLPSGTEAGQLEDSWWLSGALGLILAIILLAIATLVFITQIVILAIRGGLLLIMVVLLPVAAALAMTQTGRQMLSKYAGWILALILYKPAAAILYAIAFRLGSDEENVLNVITGLAIFVAALFMLPALMRLIVPATAAVASGGGGVGGLAAAGAGAIGATGALGVKSMMGKGGGAAAAAGGPVGMGAAAAGGAAKGTAQSIGKDPTGASSAGGGEGGSGGAPGGASGGPGGPSGSGGGGQPGGGAPASGGGGDPSSGGPTGASGGGAKPSSGASQPSGGSGGDAAGSGGPSGATDTTPPAAGSTSGTGSPSASGGGAADSNPRVTSGPSGAQGGSPATGPGGGSAAARAAAGGARQGYQVGKAAEDAVNGEQEQ